MLAMTAGKKMLAMMRTVKEDGNSEGIGDCGSSPQ